MTISQEHAFQSLDGFKLKGTFLRADKRSSRTPVLLIHGITANRDEGGFYTDIADRLLRTGFESFRFDLRGHGDSQGQMTDLTISGCLSDIVAARQALSATCERDDNPVVIAASFGGGLGAIHAAVHKVSTLVLLNPNLDFAESWLRKPGRWSDKNRLNDSAINELFSTGKLQRGEYALGRDIVNEIIHVRPADLMPLVNAPCLTIHGTHDSLVSFETAQRNYKTAQESEFIAIHGADHGFVIPGDESFSDPRTQRYRAAVIEHVVDWVERLGV